MKFLVDQAIPPSVANGLRDAGHDAIHTRDADLARASDAAIFDRAAEEDRVIVSMDTDFGTLLALRDAVRPSVVLFRRMEDRRANALLALLVANLSAVEADLTGGAIVVIEPRRVRVRRLPIAGAVDPVPKL